MSEDAHEPAPFRGRQGWTYAGRLRAAHQLRASLREQTTVVAIAETGAEYLRELLSARTVTVTTIDNGEYRDIVNVGFLPEGNMRFPEHQTYPESCYPLSHRELDVHGGYFTSTLDDPTYDEFAVSREDPEVMSIMGVAIISGGKLRGELFHTRGRDQHAFDRSDLDLVHDLATSFGTALANAIERETSSDG